MRADGGGTHLSGNLRLMQLLQGKRRSHFCLRLKHSTQLYCSLGRFADFLSSLSSLLAACFDFDEDAAAEEDASALMGDWSEGSSLALDGEGWLAGAYMAVLWWE